MDNKEEEKLTKWEVFGLFLWSWKWLLLVILVGLVSGVMAIKILFRIL